MQLCQFAFNGENGVFGSLKQGISPFPKQTDTVALPPSRTARKPNYSRWLEEGSGYKNTPNLLTGSPTSYEN